MKIETLKFNDFFKHSAEKCQLLDTMTSTAFNTVPENAFSTHRPLKARKVIKPNGFGRVIDYLFSDKDSVLYLSDDRDAAYVEFFRIDEKTSAKYVYHALIRRDLSISFAEEEVPARWHLLLPVLARMIITEWGIGGCDCETFERLKKFDDTRSVDTGLAFCDAFYYEGKEHYPDSDPIKITYGDVAVFAEVERAMKSGIFTEKYGNYVSEYDAGDFDKTKDAKSATGDSKRKQRKEKRHSLWDEIKDGKHILDFPWSPEQQACVTPLSFLDTYVPDKHFYNVFNQVEKRLNMALKRIKDTEPLPCEASKKDAVNIFIVGKPGTGKTYMIFALSAALGLPIRSIPMGKNTEEDTFEGMTKVIDGKLTEIRTPFLINGEEGGISVIEEINLASPDVVMGAIGQFVEFPYSIMEQGYKQVKRHPLNVIFGTMNIGTAGSKEVNEALSSRFSQTIVLDDPEKDDFLARLEIEGFDKKVSRWVYDRYVDIIDTLKSPDYNCEEYCLNVNFRSCLGALQAIKFGSEPKEAIRNTMIGKIAEKDMEIAERIWEMIQYKPDFIA